MSTRVCLDHVKPICAKCNKKVDQFCEVVKAPYHDSNTRLFIAECHGEKEEIKFNDTLLRNQKISFWIKNMRAFDFMH